MKFTMNGRVVEFTARTARHPTNRMQEVRAGFDCIELNETPPAHPMMTERFQFTPRRKAKAKPAPIAAKTAPTPAPVAVHTESESTMPKSTMQEKIDRINAFLKGAGQPELGVLAAEQMLKDNVMSPKRVIRFLKDQVPAKPTNHLHDAMKPAADPVADAIAARPTPPSDATTIAVVHGKPVVAKGRKSNRPATH